VKRRLIRLALMSALGFAAALLPASNAWAQG
jgi:hypothetical protein